MARIACSPRGLGTSLDIPRVALSGSEPNREGDAREGRGRGGTDCAGPLHTPDCDTRDGEGHTHWHACGGWRGVEFSSLVSPAW